MLPPIEGVELVDGVEINRRHPDTFSIPTAAEKAALRIGDFVKVGVKGGRYESERMWFRITGILLDTLTFVAQLENVPVGLPNMKIGDLLHIEPRHVLGIISPLAEDPPSIH